MMDVSNYKEKKDNKPHIKNQKEKKERGKKQKNTHIIFLPSPDNGQ